MLASASFRLPLALDRNGRLVPPEEASKGARYRCPSCNTDVDLHAGAQKKAHFHHRVATCSFETVLHLTAKRCIVDAVDAWRTGGPAPVFVRRCESRDCGETTLQPMPKKITSAVEEMRLRSGHVVDVALLGVADLPVAAIEVLVSHAVDATKATELGVPWVEVAAEDVCASRGLVLTPVRDRFIPWLCAEHVSERGEAKRDERTNARLRTKLLRALPYRVEDFPGFTVDGIARCPRGHDTLVFAWKGREPPWPRPLHVVATANDDDSMFDATQGKAVRVLPFRRRWATACSTCGAVVVG